MPAPQSIESGGQTAQKPTQAHSSLMTILVASDFSASSTAALNWATDLAKAHNAQVVVVHAIDTELPAIAEAQGPITQHVRHKMKMIHGSIKANGVAGRTDFESGKPWDVIAKIAKETDADLIVIGAHGTSKLSERVLGTVADRLIRITSTPVLVHRESKSQAKHPVRTVLAATDFSEEAALGISAAVRLLRGAKEPARLVLFHAIALFINYGDFTTPVTVPQYWDDAERSAAQRLETLAASLRSERLQVEVRTFRGYPADAILHEAATMNADLIAIGTVGRGGLNRFFMGSVAERVLHHATCPVLTVRKPGADEPIRLSAERPDPASPPHG